ncbi:hypothetical protein ABK040_007049 [Willaertia magna]
MFEEHSSHTLPFEVTCKYLKHSFYETQKLLQQNKEHLDLTITYNDFNINDKSEYSELLVFKLNTILEKLVIKYLVTKHNLTHINSETSLKDTKFSDYDCELHTNGLLLSKDLSSLYIVETNHKLNEHNFEMLRRRAKYVEELIKSGNKCPRVLKYVNEIHFVLGTNTVGEKERREADEMNCLIIDINALC